MKRFSMFDFGRNWDLFSRNALSAEKVAQARRSFMELMAGISLEGRSFLDVGFGQGLSLLAAADLGAVACGCDIHSQCADVLERNRAFYPRLARDSIRVFVGSILDEKIVRQLQADIPRGYDVVHSWGVLHHTGDMNKALHHSAALVGPKGYLVIALYNRHWSSPLWKGIKWFYNRCPAWARRILVGVFYPVIYLAKRLVTGHDPRKKDRGMDFYYDVIDWVGGYPYEYATIDEVEFLMHTLGFETVRVIPAGVPTGCNEFVFRKVD